jgi:hypothetical protein
MNSEQFFEQMRKELWSVLLIRSGAAMLIIFPRKLWTIGLTTRIASCRLMPAKSGGLNGSMQHWLEVYAEGFKAQRSLADGDVIDDLIMGLSASSSVP